MVIKCQPIQSKHDPQEKDASEHLLKHPYRAMVFLKTLHLILDDLFC